MKKNINLILFFFVMFTVLSCAETQTVENCVNGETVGFLYGIVHGMFIVPSFIISLFTDDVAIYAVNNSGALYNLGYIIGLLCTLKGGSYIKKKNK